MILVSGIPRSGTTWISKVISHSENVTYCHEPDNEHNNLLGYVYKQKIPRFPYLTSEYSRNGIFKIFKNVINGNYLFGYAKSSLLIKKLLRINIDKVENEVDQKCKYITSLDNTSYTIPRHRKIQRKLAKKLYRLVLLFKKKDYSDQRILTKSVHSILALSYLQNYFDPYTVIVIRHPANIVSSHLKLDNPDIWRNIFNQKALSQNHLAPFKDKVKSLDHPLAKAGAQVSAIYYVLDKQLQNHSEWITTKHEKFCLEPTKKFQSLFEQLDLEWSKSIRNRITELNKEGEGYTYKRQAKNQIDKWKHRLDTKQIIQIKKGYSIFPHCFYSDFITNF